MQAVVRVTGSAGRFEGFRERLRWLLVREPDADPYTEHHGADGLEYRFDVAGGMPFPALAAASADFPELRVEAEWDNAARGVRGRAVIENGHLVEQDTAPLGDPLLEVSVALEFDGSIAFAAALVPVDGGWHGYLADAGRHGYVEIRTDALRVALGAGTRWTHRVAGAAPQAHDVPIDPAALAALEDVAFRFAGSWLWFDESPPEDSGVERRRYADHGWPVRGANLRAQRLLAIGVGQSFEALTPGAGAACRRLRALWPEIR